MAFLTIVVDNAHLSRIDQLAAKLRTMGFNVRNIGRTLGFIDGDTDADPSIFQKVDGVKMVAPERKFFAAEAGVSESSRSEAPTVDSQFRRVEGA
ncbi:MAG: hypothetical protein J0M17_16380 [Planctomycetes bacterium]|nr:hypothetical protein [Planctomycetota bacterium]